MAHSILEISAVIVLIFILILLLASLLTTIGMCYIYKLDFFKEFLLNLKIASKVLFIFAIIFFILYQIIL